MKALYTEPEIRISKFDSEGVIVASSPTTTEWELDEDELPPWIIQ